MGVVVVVEGEDTGEDPLEEVVITSVVPLGVVHEDLQEIERMVTIIGLQGMIITRPVFTAHEEGTE